VKPGDWVRTVESLVGTAQGPSAEHGDGALREIPIGARCEVFDVEGTTGWLTVHYDLEDSGPLESYRVEAIAEPRQLVPATRPRLPDPIPEGTPDYL
jgi:hypothetical protein